MPQYMLLLHSDPEGWKHLSPEEMQKMLEKYHAWMHKPFIKGGMRLDDDPGRVVRSQNGKPHATDGPYSETKEVFGGYYLIEAADYAEAVERSLDHPTLEHGTIEIRQVYQET